MTTVNRVGLEVAIPYEGLPLEGARECLAQYGLLLGDKAHLRIKPVEVVYGSGKTRLLIKSRVLQSRDGEGGRVIPNPFCEWPFANFPPYVQLTHFQNL